MLLKSISEFIIQIGKLTLLRYDQDLLKDLISQFNLSDQTSRLERVISEIEIKTLTECFARRWFAIKDANDDYFFNSSGVNAYWIALAKELVSDVPGKSYLQILVPTIESTTDNNTLRQLPETLNLEDFFLAQGDKTVYTKLGLCLRVIRAEPFSLWRNQIEPRALSVIELARLKSCPASRGEFSINWLELEIPRATERFCNFWEFIERRALPHLQDRAALPFELLPKLMDLIEYYHRLKNINESFDLFKAAAYGFFEDITHLDMHSINYFYGIKIQLEGKKYYLLDILIKVHNSKGYTLNKELNALVECLYLDNPYLRRSCTELQSLFKPLHTSSTRLVIQERPFSAEDKSPCLRMLVSLFTTQFEILLSGYEIKFWDKSNKVPSTAQELYFKLIGILEPNNQINLTTVYREILEILQHKKDETGFVEDLKRMTIGELNKDWYEFVRTNQLRSLDIYWFNTEVLLLACARHRMLHPSAVLDRFLDALINTCEQKNNEISKQLRVNILFVSMLKEMNENEKHPLLQLIHMLSPVHAKDQFINHCYTYILSRLANCKLPLMAGSPSGSSPKLFNPFNKIDATKLELDITGLTTVQQLVQKYKEAVEKNKHIHPELIYVMLDYLQTLSHPFLSLEESRVAKTSSLPIDYCGQPS